MSRRVPGPERLVAAAQTTVNSNKILGITSSDKLLRLASGDISVLPVPPAQVRPPAPTQRRDESPSG